jgi:TonB family protein
VIASWMLFALALSALFTVAAFAAERVLKGYEKPVRFVWLGAMVLSVLWPVAPTIARMLPTPPQPVNVLPFTIVVSAPSVISADEAAAMMRSLFIDRALIAVWMGLSLLLVARLVRGNFLLETSRRLWKRGRVNGVRVQVSDNVGPAVVGLRSMDVVVPEWIFSLDEHLRAMVLRHEEEHRLARDPYLLFAASVLVALMPWNVALWIQARRLRLGIEMDCDARVLRAHPSPERYGMLILTIAQRKSLAPAQFAPMLSEPKTNLERRILAMRTTKAARATIVGGGFVTFGVLLLASSLQSAPTSFAQTRAALTQRFVAALPSAFAPAETIPVTKPKPADAQKQASPSPSRSEVRKLNAVVVTTVAQPGGPANPAPRYPDILRAAEVEGAVVARVSYDSQGDAEGITIVTSTHKLLSNAVENALKQWHGPAKTSTQVPFVFVMTNKTAKDLASYPGGMPAGAQVITAAPMSERELADRMAAGNGPTPVNENQTYFEFQVEKPVTSQPGNPAPRYPTELRAAGVEGEVLAQFVVDQDGNPDMSTFKVLKTDHDLFTAAVSNALPNMHFSAAQVGGKAVKQLVQMPFQFSLSKP